MDGKALIRWAEDQHWPYHDLDLLHEKLAGTGVPGAGPGWVMGPPIWCVCASCGQTYDGRCRLINSRVFLVPCPCGCVEIRGYGNKPAPKVETWRDRPPML